MGVLSGIEEYVLSFVDGMGLIGLAILSFTEAIIQPVPPDVINGGTAPVPSSSKVAQGGF